MAALALAKARVTSPDLEEKKRKRREYDDALESIGRDDYPDAARLRELLGDDDPQVREVLRTWDEEHYL